MTSTAPTLERDPYAVALDEVAALDKQIAMLSAVRARHVTEAQRQLHRQAPVDTSWAGPQWPAARVERVELLTELALLTHRTECRTATLVDTSAALLTSLPLTLAALAAGVVSWEHAEVIAKHAQVLRDDALVSYDEKLSSLAAQLNPKQLEKKARAQVELSQPATSVERAEAAVKTRRMYVEPAEDGMARLTLIAPAPEVHAIADRAVRLATGLKQGGDPRSMSHLKVDVLCDLLLNGETSIPGATRGIRGRVHVMVPAMTILGVGDEAAILRGYGPIDPATAARLTADATSWRRILTDPITGRILATDPRDYRPTAKMADHARLVHPECVFPGCTVPAEHADVDHTEAYSVGGDTVDGNLAPLSQDHHRVKHHTRWQFVQNDDDSITSTSPAGHVYTVYPEGRMQPAPKALVEAVEMTAEEGLTDCPF
jgi:hypothetical protein